MRPRAGTKQDVYASPRTEDRPQNKAWEPATRPVEHTVHAPRLLFGRLLMSSTRPGRGRGRARLGARRARLCAWTVAIAHVRCRLVLCLSRASGAGGVLSTRALVGMVKRGRVCIGMITITAMDECRHRLAELTIHSRARESGVILRRCVLASWSYRVSLRSLNTRSEVGLICPIGCTAGYGGSVSGVILGTAGMI